MSSKRIKGKHLDIVVNSVHIRDEIKRQISQRGLSYKALSDKCQAYGHYIDPATLSRYFSGKPNITQRDILFICALFGIVIKLDVFVEPVNYVNLKTKMKLMKKSWLKDS
jgi:transcriptional regulator with XRE-family HTH domain